MLQLTFNINYVRLNRYLNTSPTLLRIKDWVGFTSSLYSKFRTRVNVTTVKNIYEERLLQDHANSMEVKKALRALASISRLSFSINYNVV